MSRVRTPLSRLSIRVGASALALSSLALGLSTADHVDGSKAVWEGIGCGAVVIDVNRADGGMLMLLPGIGPGLSDRILADRAERGPFRSVQDLERVRGIGARTVSRLAPHAVAR